ncbi:hypothetical protein FACS1894172_21260 [Spirochaetia bacterium]|nr:hypothetical protein FACS1894164_20240 [Spirochaetia bacterium]GHU37701.1 hypothetical protein FACS1894172_21260 [Spirochaetia bacterium]
MNITLNDIKRTVNKLASKIDAPKDSLPTFGYSKDFGYPHIEIDENNFYYVIMERGQILEKKATNNIDTLLYWIFDSVTFRMAGDFELSNRIEAEDCRRIIFIKQEELLGTLNENWQKDKENYHTKVLEKSPFDDNSGLRATLCGKLRKEGYSEKEIENMAYEKYPLN